MIIVLFMHINNYARRNKVVEEFTWKNNSHEENNTCGIDYKIFYHQKSFSTYEVWFYHWLHLLLILVLWNFQIKLNCPQSRHLAMFWKRTAAKWRMLNMMCDTCLTWNGNMRIHLIFKEVSIYQLFSCNSTASVPAYCIM